MASGPEHYRKAEELVEEVTRRVQGYSPSEIASPTVMALVSNLMAKAQVHATLAQAAATVDARRGGSEVWAGWPAPKVAVAPPPSPHL